MQWLINIFDKSGVIGTILAATGCASCFPALGTLGSSLGLAFLSQYEGLFINTLLPIFAWIALVASVLSFLAHRLWLRLIAGITGPTMVLLSLYPLWQYNWSTYLFYTGLVVMLLVAIWDLISPARKTCVTSISTEVTK